MHYEPNVNEAMQDLETVGLPEYGPVPVIAIGAVAFNNKDRIISEFYMQVNLQSEVDAGAPLQPGTMAWWLQQHRSARKKFFDNGEAPHAIEVLDAFSEWYAANECQKIWGNGAEFDNAILAQMYHRHGRTPPWHYRHSRCLRTVWSESEYRPQRERTGIPHFALDDARYQAEILLDIREYENALRQPQWRD